MICEETKYRINACNFVNIENSIANIRDHQHCADYNI